MMLLISVINQSPDTATIMNYEAYLTVISLLNILYYIRSEVAMVNMQLRCILEPIMIYDTKQITIMNDARLQMELYCDLLN